jgi:hypothetical protein
VFQLQVGRLAGVVAGQPRPLVVRARGVGHRRPPPASRRSRGDARTGRRGCQGAHQRLHRAPRR